MLILVGCEESQAVTIELRKLGHEAYSCDLLPCSGGHPEWHIQGDVIQAILSRNWDMAILFPDCTYLAVSGLHWNKRVQGRAQKTEDALQFVARILNLCIRQGIKKIGMENPVGCISTRIIQDTGGRFMVLPETTKQGFKPAQIIQPYIFGNDASKATCLWLIGLPKLVPENHLYVWPRTVCSFNPRHIQTLPIHVEISLRDGCIKCGAKVKPRWANQTDSGQNKLGPSEDRASKRSKTYSGIARAMADQWTK